jgi:hypothetical protein
MNRLILRYAYPVTIAILAVFVWVVYQRISRGSDILPLVVAGVIVWVIGVPGFIYFWPRLTVNGFKRAILKRGLGGGPIPLNTLYAAPSTSSPSAPQGSLLATGTDDLLYVAGWLDLSREPQILRVPDMADRYYSLQFTNPSDSANFAYIGKRTTGTKAGSYLLSGPGWRGEIPDGMIQISSPNRSVLVVGRVFVESESDLPVAYGLATQIQLTPLGR